MHGQDRLIFEKILINVGTQAKLGQDFFFSFSVSFSVQFDFDLEEFDSISENAQDFISQLLKKSPRIRLNADQCLEHRNAVPPSRVAPVICGVA